MNIEEKRPELNVLACTEKFTLEGDLFIGLIPKRIHEWYDRHDSKGAKTHNKGSEEIELSISKILVYRRTEVMLAEIKETKLVKRKVVTSTRTVKESRVTLMTLDLWIKKKVPNTPENRAIIRRIKRLKFSYGDFQYVNDDEPLENHGVPIEFLPFRTQGDLYDAMNGTVRWGWQCDPPRVLPIYRTSYETLSL